MARLIRRPIFRYIDCDALYHIYLLHFQGKGYIHPIHTHEHSYSYTSLTVRGCLCWPRGQCAQLGHGRLPFCEICPHKTLHIKQREDKDTSWVARNFY